MKIKAKLILLFILIKVIPLLLISYIAVIGAQSLNSYFSASTKSLFNDSKTIISNTANTAINDSIKALDKKSQTSIELLSYNLANEVASFLYERDADLLLLSKLPISQKVLRTFFDNKTKSILEHDKYYYDDDKSVWKNEKQNDISFRKNKKAVLVDNKKEFNYIDPINLNKKDIPIYKEVVYFDLKGNEQFKVSSISKNKLDISKKENTYIKAETYFDQINTLKKGEIYVSDVIGEYVGSKIILLWTVVFVQN